MYKILILASIFAIGSCDSPKAKFKSSTQVVDIVNGFDQNGFDPNGYDQEGYDNNGFDKDGYDKNGFDKNGFDKDGFNKDGIDQNGNNKSGEYVGVIIGGSGSKECIENTINFEDMVGLPVKTPITDRYVEKFGVTFSLSDGSAPMLLEHFKGDPEGLSTFFGWVCSTCTEGDVDWPYGPGKLNSVQPEDKERIGNYSLSGPNEERNLVISYNTSVHQASGTLMDVDATEKWTITAYNDAGVQTAKHVVTNGRGDGLGTDWKIVSTAPFTKLIMEFDLTGVGGGFALDLFSPARVCN